MRLNASGQSPNRLHCSALLLLAPLGPTLASSQSTAPCKVVSPPLTPYTPPQVRLNATVHDAAGAVLAAHTLKAPLHTPVTYCVHTYLSHATYSSRCSRRRYIRLTAYYNAYLPLHATYNHLLHTLKAPGWDVPFWGPHRAELSLPKAAAEVRLRLVWLLTMHCFTPYCLLTTHYLTYYLTTYHLLKKAS